MQKNIFKYLPKLFFIGIAFIFTACSYHQKNEDIFEKGELLSQDIITGKSYHNKIVEEDDIYTTAVGVEKFEAGARNVWHSHPSGQIIIVLDGVGYHQIEGKKIEIMKKGDVVKCPPNVLHWHGASKHSSVTQMYILPNTQNGLANFTTKKVSDDEYNGAKE
ncbi:Cupin domain-containing protein [Aliarcobacter faecis]|uniref:cupin domain-containing protein n=1 Tax=Aliarcobacter faecis TaxID=1564138 RepID=UPI0004B12508|nr:cupin domain-containing protein [Aliarcobacter faecis]QKF73632.1 Cupin domain-containing protein [Aliarcobacter faecis]